MRCDWDLILRILLKALSYESSYPTVFTNGAVYNGKCQEIKYNDEEEFAKVFTNILYIGDYDLAVVRDLGGRAAVAIDRITPKGHIFIDKALVLMVIEETIATERAIAKKLNLKQHTVNYYLEQFKNNGFIKAEESLPLEDAGKLEYIDCRLTSKGKVALDNLSLLLEESSKSSNDVNQNYYAPVYGVAGNVQGNQNVNLSVKKESLSEANIEMQRVQKQLQKILILEAIPHGLNLGREIREIGEAIRRATKRDLFDIRIRTAVRPQDIRRAIAEEQPQIVHFCGHGLDNGYLLLEDDGGNDKPVAPEALASLFKLHANYVKCVLLNACYSEIPAKAINEHIDYVIGMNNPIQDKAAIEFAKGFYDGLGYELLNNQNIFERAFDEAMVAILMENISQGQIPVLKKKL